MLAAKSHVRRCLRHISQRHISMNVAAMIGHRYICYLCFVNMAKYEAEAFPINATTRTCMALDI